MKRQIIFLLLIWFPVFGNTRPSPIDSLSRAFRTASNDPSKFQLTRILYNYYENSNRDSARYFNDIGIQLARKNKKNLGEATVLISDAYLFINAAQYAASLQNLIKAIAIIEKVDVEKDNWILDDPGKAKFLTLSYAHQTYGNLMTATQNPDLSVYHYKQALHLGESVKDPIRQILANLGLGRTYMDLNRLDSALLFEQQAERISLQSGYNVYLSPVYSYMGLIYLKKGEHGLGLKSLYRGIEEGIKSVNNRGLAQNYFQLTNYFLGEHEKDSALLYAKKFEGLMENLGSVSLSTIDKGMAYENLYRAYSINNQTDSAFKYQGLALLTNRKLFQDRINSLAAFQTLSFKEQMRLQELEKANETFKNRVIVYAMLAGLLVFVIISYILYRNNREKQKANMVLESTLANLQSTQALLIQSEKMASLGELTAGIAHEIQNPLNFVNNFSEVSKELVEEVKSERAKVKSERDEGLEGELLEDIAQNLEKINHHGKRADAIVKGMLQHSRTSSGQMEPSDINALCDEYLRLAYHGLKAKDPSLNASFHFTPDNTLPKVNVIPQDMGRVLLNLINNAFQAVSGYGGHPAVTVSTLNKDNVVEIKVADNGPGIPENIKDKIFQPFFTTKPTGQGTGLGLSLSYDIVKAHGGALMVETLPAEVAAQAGKEGEGSTFIIQLPLKSIG